MNQLVKTEFFRLLAKNSQTVTTLEMQHAYENFMNHVISVIQSEIDSVEVFRTLSLARIELQSLRLQILYEQGEKCA